MTEETTPETIRFELDGRTVEARPGETIWQVADRLGTEIPHLCWKPAPGYRADGNCRACMVEIEGERTLAASCVRTPAAGMKVRTASDRAKTARSLVMELLVADQPARAEAHQPDSTLWRFAEGQGVESSRFPARDAADAGIQGDGSHPGIAVNLDACIQCNLCVRACREVQVNDVIGLAWRGHRAKIVFDFDDAMGASTCVGCGECVQACPTGALMPKTALDEFGLFKGKADRQVESVCPYCGVGCQLTFNVKDDAIAWVDGREGPANASRLCVKGRYGFDYVANPQRLTKPLIRRDDVPKSASLPIDPANPYTHFREASWDEALDRAAGGLKAIREKHGGAGLAGFGSAKGSNEEAYLVQKLVRAGFGTNNVDHCTRLCHASSVAALMETIGSGAVTAGFREAENADVIVVIGANPTVNHPVAATFIKNAAKRGARLVVLDPRGQALTRHATHMLQFKPGSDVALLNAMMNVIVTEERFDRQYIDGFTEGFEALKASVAPFTPEAMSPICGIAPERIREVARLYAGAERAIIFWGMGVSQHTHGTDNARCLISLAMMCGQIGRPGTGLHPLRGQNNVQGASDAGLIPMFFPDYKSVEDTAVHARYREFWGDGLDPKKGLTVVEITDAIHAGTIRGVYIMGENPAMSDPDQHHTRSALEKLEHLVVQDIFLTETAAFADVVLPASAFPEKSGTFTNTNRQVQMGRQAIDPPGDARQDWWIVQELARRLDLGWDYAGPADVFAEMAQVMPSLANISWERLQREDSVTYPCPGPDQPGKGVIFGDGFPTASGRGRFVPTDILPPDEVPDAAFPLVLTTGRLLEHWHTGSMTRRASVLDAIEPDPHVHVNPDDLGRWGIAPGEQVRVATRRGAIELAARSDPNLPEGVVFIPFCFTEAAANFLTNPALDPFGKIPELKFSAARLERADEAALADAAQ
ncbi:formate dehydrogenase subunit alpha [Thalassobaculum fulvum]|uniref:Formate dehydrogenase subunit alpha n=1 Tax=Thalassobaculum fulvum TaxID=1633335 RepID=A0A918XW51_9PROT|nr:formate dehydrogenase subunit alpha [Thalassobaculum fulvum]GHD60790.1 formate dehydrogenase subunit alpha [Thalassobaculum fulvum]